MKKLNIRILIVDDHRIVIDGLKSLLEDDPAFYIVATTTDSRDVLRIIENNAVDVLLTDVMMPNLSGQEPARQARKNYPATRILALSMSGQGDVVSEMINDADISGYVLKNISKAELTKAILKIASGGIYFSDEVLDE